MTGIKVPHKIQSQKIQAFNSYCHQAYQMTDNEYMIKKSVFFIFCLFIVNEKRPSACRVAQQRRAAAVVIGARAGVAAAVAAAHVPAVARRVAAPAAAARCLGAPEARASVAWNAAATRPAAPPHARQWAPSARTRPRFAATPPQCRRPTGSRPRSSKFIALLVLSLTHH